MLFVCYFGSEMTDTCTLCCHEKLLRYLHVMLTGKGVRVGEWLRERAGEVGRSSKETLPTCWWEWRMGSKWTGNNIQPLNQIQWFLSVRRTFLEMYYNKNKWVSDHSVEIIWIMFAWGYLMSSQQGWNIPIKRYPWSPQMITTNLFLFLCHTTIDLMFCVQF